MQHPSQDHYELIDSPTHDQSPHPNHTCSQPRSCNSDGDTPTLGQPRSTDTLPFDDPTETKDESLFSDDNRDSTVPTLPPKPEYENVTKFRRKMSSDGQSYNNDHQRNPPSQSSTACGATDQRRFTHLLIV